MLTRNILNRANLTFNYFPSLEDRFKNISKWSMNVYCEDNLIGSMVYYTVFCLEKLLSSHSSQVRTIHDAVNNLLLSDFYEAHKEKIKSGAFLYIDSFSLHKEFRGKNLGYVVIDDIIDGVAPYCSFAMMRPAPLRDFQEEFEGGCYYDAVAKLQRYWGEMGFIQLRSSCYFILPLWDRNK